MAADRSGGHAPFAKPKWPDPCAFLFTHPFFRRRGRNSSASRAVEMGSGASRALVATVSPFHKFSWPLIGRAATPHSQNLNGWIHAHSLSRLLSFFGSAATPCSVAGVAASPLFFALVGFACICSFVCLPYLGTGLGRAAMQSMGTREGRKKGQEPARRLRATLNPKRVVFGWPWGGLVRNVMACAMGRGGVKK